MKWLLRLLVIALILVLGSSVASIIYSFHQADAAGDCVTYGATTSCSAGPHPIFGVAGVIGLFAGVFGLAAGVPNASGIASRLAGWYTRLIGRDATATVVAVSHTDPIRLLLQVTPDDGSPPYEAQVRKLASRLATPRPGDQVRVRYLPSDPSMVAIADGASFVSSRASAAGIPGAYGVTAAAAFHGTYGATGPAGTPGAYDVNSELMRLTSMLQSGAITSKQYEAITDILMAPDQLIRRPVHSTLPTLRTRPRRTWQRFVRHR